MAGSDHAPAQPPTTSSLEYSGGSLTRLCRPAREGRPVRVMAGVVPGIPVLQVSQLQVGSGQH